MFPGFHVSAYQRTQGYVSDEMLRASGRLQNKLP